MQLKEGETLHLPVDEEQSKWGGREEKRHGTLHCWDEREQENLWNHSWLRA